LIGRKRMDWSILNAGTTGIPKNIVGRFEAAKSVPLPTQGHPKRITLHIGSDIHPARMVENRPKSDRGEPEYRIEIQRPLKDLLRARMHVSLEHVHAHIMAPESLGEYLEFWQTDEPWCYRVIVDPRI
jgi:hypothetical protein